MFFLNVDLNAATAQHLLLKRTLPSKKKHRKLLRGVELISDSYGTFILRKHSNKQCVFLDQNKRCKIYDIRPQTGNISDRALTRIIGIPPKTISDWKKRDVDNYRT
jgi:hypothetical protein